MTERGSTDGSLAHHLLQEVENKLELAAAMLSLPILTVEQMVRYESAREFLFFDEESKWFVGKVKKNMRSFPNQVTSVYILGESGGTGKLGEAGQWIAEVLLDEVFRLLLFTDCHKDPAVHYLGLGMGARELREEGKITTPHLNYRRSDFEKMWLRLAQTSALARICLPRMEPDKVHLLLHEFPLNLVGDAMVVDPNTFVKFRKTYHQAQQDAAEMRRVFSKNVIKGKVVEEYKKYKTILDEDEVNPEDMAWVQGDRESAERGREWVNNQALKLQEEMKGPFGSIPRFTLQTLLKDFDFRNNVVVPAVAETMIQDWRLRFGQWLIGKEPYIEGEKNIFWRLIKSKMLNMQAVREYGLI